LKEFQKDFRISRSIFSLLLSGFTGSSAEILPVVSSSVLREGSLVVLFKFPGAFFVGLYIFFGSFCASVEVETFWLEISFFSSGDDFSPDSGKGFSIWSSGLLSCFFF
jgi:hypothetical protein